MRSDKGTSYCGLLLPPELEPPMLPPELEPPMLPSELDPLPDEPVLEPLLLGLELDPELEPPAPELPDELPLDFIADSNSVRLIWPLLSASARVNSSPGTLAASERSIYPLPSASSCEKLDEPPDTEPLVEPEEPAELPELLPR